MGSVNQCPCCRNGTPTKRDFTDLVTETDPHSREASILQKAVAAGRRLSVTMGQISLRPKLSRNEIRDLQRHVSFSEDEIKDWYREFCRSTNRSQEDLFLTEEEFVKVYNSVYPGQSGEFAMHIFRTFDQSGSGRVSFREFLIGLSFSGSADPKKQLSWAFKVYDVQKTGYVTKDDMTQIVRSVFKMIGPRTLGSNDTSKTPESVADELFQEMDVDGKQRISWEEFCGGASRNPMALQLLQCGPPNHADSEDPDFD